MRATERAERVDSELVEQAHRGDREAFAILARTRGELMFGIARRILRDGYAALIAWSGVLIPLLAVSAAVWLAVRPFRRRTTPIPPAGDSIER